MKDPKGRDDDTSTTVLRHPDPLAKEAPLAIAPYLAVIAGSETGKEVEIGLDPIRVGRRNDNDLVLADPCVSAHHCVITFQEGCIWVTDLDSTNGTLIDGTRIEGRSPWPLGAPLQLGNQILRQEYRRREEVQRSSALTAELQRAATYVYSLLPRPSATGPISTAWYFAPSAELGGDIFDYRWLDADRFLFYLLDVCGHGIGAALHSVSIFNLLRQQSLLRVDFAHPRQVLAALNEALPMEKHASMYFTLWYGLYRRTDRTLTFASAGHPPALLFADGARRIERLATANPPLGVMAGADFRENSTRVPPHSRLYLYSDGVYEITTPDGRLWGWDHFFPWLRAGVINGQGQPEHIGEKLRTLTRDGRFEDDCSLLMLDFGP